MISFDCKNVALPNLNFEKIKEWITVVAESHNFSVRKVNYLFCDDSFILEANRKFLNHDYFTDIITFDYTANDKIAGDIIISLDTVKSNALELGETYERELLRVIIHGILHLCGINDKGPGEREIMEMNENRAINLLLN